VDELEGRLAKGNAPARREEETVAAVDVQADVTRWAPDGLTGAEVREYVGLRELEESLLQGISRASDKLRRARGIGPQSRTMVRHLEQVVTEGYERLRHVRARIEELEAFAAKRRKRGRGRPWREPRVRVLTEELR
jgi:hypothetical protein